jgi:hypothetical protein
MVIRGGAVISKSAGVELTAIRQLGHVGGGPRRITAGICRALNSYFTVVWRQQLGNLAGVYSEGPLRGTHEKAEIGTVAIAD